MGGKERLNYTKIRRLDHSDVPLILEMLDSCNPFKYAKKDTQVSLNSFLIKGSFIPGVFVKEELAGYAVTSNLMGESAKTTFHNYNVFTEREVWGNVGILDNCVIRDKYRGRGYQQELLKIREAILWDFGLKEICTSVHMKNTYSINNLIKAGYKHIGQHIIQKDWMFFRKVLDGPVSFEDSSCIVL